MLAALPHIWICLLQASVFRAMLQLVQNEFCVSKLLPHPILDIVSVCQEVIPFLLAFTVFWCMALMVFIACRWY